MATKKDLVEAHAFSRRRLVTAFVSGAPGGREVEPARPGRMIVGGAALAVLLIAGAAIAGALHPRADVDWDEPGLVTDDHGALYVVLDEADAAGQPVLRSVINVTSAQLILGSTATAKKVPADELAKQSKGTPIGILGAPATVPAPTELLGSGWTACTGTGLGIKASVRKAPSVRRASGSGFVVQDAKTKESFLVAEAEVPGVPTRAYRYALPDNDALHTALGVSPTDRVVVPHPWLDLFPAGGSLDAKGLAIPGLGEPAQAPGFPGALVGDWYDSNGTPVALTRDGGVELTPFAAAVLRSTSLGKRRPRQLDVGEDADAQIGDDKPYEASQWPEQRLDGSPSPDSEVCGQLETAKGEEPAVRLATDPTGEASAEGVAASAQDASVQSGYGALVRSAEWMTDHGGSVFLVDDRGYSYPVAGADEVERLGYARVPDLVVPDSWNKLFKQGTELSREAALCPPAAAGPTARRQSCS